MTGSVIQDYKDALAELDTAPPGTLWDRHQVLMRLEDRIRRQYPTFDVSTLWPAWEHPPLPADAWDVALRASERPGKVPSESVAPKDTRDPTLLAFLAILQLARGQRLVQSDHKETLKTLKRHGDHSKAWAARGWIETKGDTLLFRSGNAWCWRITDEGASLAATA